jgi:pyrroloquinoline quinone biosynthesis protein B
VDAWERWDRDLAREVEAVDVALLDATFWSLDELPGRTLAEVPHPLATRTMDLLQGVADRNGARIVLTHLNNSNPALLEDGPQAAEVARRGFEIAREGMRFAL